MLRSIPLAAAFALMAGLLLAPVDARAQETGVSGELERIAATTPQEKIQYASDALEEMRGDVKTVQKLLEEARKDGDAATVQCVNNSLTALRALLQVSENANVSMTASLNDNKSDMADHEFRKIAVALEKSRELAAEADRCNNEGPAGPEQTTVEITGETGTDGDTNPPTVTDLDIGIDPPEASVFQ